MSAAFHLRLMLACAATLLFLPNVASITGRSLSSRMNASKQRSLGKEGVPQFNRTCRHWGVTIGISEPTEAVRRAASLGKTWCVIVVFASAAPLGAWQSFMRANSFQTDRIILLPVELQHQLFQNASLFEALPEGHIAWKNIGYLTALRFGGQLVFDLDHHSMVSLSAVGTEMPFTSGVAGVETNTPKGAAAASSKSKSRKETDAVLHLDNARVPVHNREAYDSSASVESSFIINPYAVLGASKAHTFPRGVPFSDALEQLRSALPLAYVRTDKIMEFIAPWHGGRTSFLEVGVVQSTVEDDPNEAAISKLSLGAKLTFPRSTSSVLIPHGSYAPFHSAAAIFTKRALWALLLPITVASEVADVWRSYAAQRIFRDTGLQLAFVNGGMSRSSVGVVRNTSAALEEAIVAETPLYARTRELLTLIDHWTCPASRPTVAFCMQQLWYTMHAHNFVEKADVELVRVWFNELESMGYRFPSYLQPNQLLQLEVERSKVGKLVPSGSSGKQPFCVYGSAGRQVVPFARLLARLSVPARQRLLCHGQEVRMPLGSRHETGSVCSSCTRLPKGLLPARPPAGKVSLRHIPPERALIVKIDYSPGLGNLLECLAAHFATAMALSREVLFVRDKAKEGDRDYFLIEVMFESFASLRERDVTDTDWWADVAPRVVAGNATSYEWLRSSSRYVQAPAFCGKLELRASFRALELAAIIGASRSLVGPVGRPYCMITLPPKVGRVRREKGHGIRGVGTCILSSLFGRGPDPTSPVGRQLHSYMHQVANDVGTYSRGNVDKRSHAGSDVKTRNTGRKTASESSNEDVGTIDGADGGSRASRSMAESRHLLLALHVRVGDGHAFESLGTRKSDNRLKKSKPDIFPWEDYFLCVQRVAVLFLADSGMAKQQSNSDVLPPSVRLSWYIATDWSPGGMTTGTPLWKAAERVFNGGMYNSTLLAPAAGSSVHTSAHSHPTNVSAAQFQFGVRRVLFEHVILSRADYIFNSHSTFSATAAEVGLTNAIEVGLTERIGGADSCKP